MFFNGPDVCSAFQINPDYDSACCVSVLPVTVILPVENTCTVLLRFLILYDAAGWISGS